MGGSSSYTEVEYLKVGSGDYQIDIGVLGKPDVTIEGLFKFVPYSYQQIILGSRATNGNTRFNPISFLDKNRSDHYEISFGSYYSTTISMTTDDITLWKFVYNNNLVEVYKNGEKVLNRSGSYWSSDNPALSMSIFAANWYGNALLKYKTYTGTQVGAFRVYQDNKLVRDFIPVRVGRAGALFDKVDEEFYFNLLDGNFILGSDK